LIVTTFVALDAVDTKIELFSKKNGNLNGFPLVVKAPDFNSIPFLASHAPSIRPFLLNPRNPSPNWSSGSLKFIPTNLPSPPSRTGSSNAPAVLQLLIRVYA
jgi:hypothetical protein